MLKSSFFNVCTHTHINIEQLFRPTQAIPPIHHVKVIFWFKMAPLDI